MDQWSSWMHILPSINCDKMCFLCLSHNTYCVWGKPLEFYEAIWTACKTAEGKTSWIFNNRVKQSMWYFHWQLSLSLFHVKMGSVVQMQNKNQTSKNYDIHSICLKSGMSNTFYRKYFHVVSEKRKMNQTPQKSKVQAKSVLPIKR